MRYKFFYQPPNHCIPCCLQSIFDRRNIPVDQNQIVKELQTTSQGVFIKRDLEPLRSFLKEYRLNIGFFRPFNEIVEPDIFLSDLNQNTDLMVGFMYQKLYDPLNQKDKCHFALLDKFKPYQEKEIFLHDNQRRRIENVSLSNLVKAMKQQEQCGFYVIS